jgi:hypothetical protein
MLPVNGDHNACAYIGVADACLKNFNKCCEGKGKVASVPKHVHEGVDWGMEIKLHTF